MKCNESVCPTEFEDPIQAPTARGEAVPLCGNKNADGRTFARSRHRSKGIDLSMHIMGAKNVLDVAASVDIPLRGKDGGTHPSFPEDPRMPPDRPGGICKRFPNLFVYLGHSNRDVAALGGTPLFMSFSRMCGEGAYLRDG